MYELSRVRLHSVGPKGARYHDVTLDLRGVGPLTGQAAPLQLWPVTGGDGHDSSRRPSPATVLFLENGGGKSVLIKLIFSVMLPGRRQVVGTSSTRVLDKFVLANDVAHVVLEWQDTKTGQLLVTGKASEWSGHVVSADPSRLTERWYSFRPTAIFGLDDLPFTQDGRIVSLSGYHDRLVEKHRADPELQFGWEKGHSDWTAKLERLRLDPELFVYQRKMNAGEGEAADAFAFKTDEAFVDWLLTAIIPDEEPENLGDLVVGHAEKLAKRGELAAEREFVEGALGRLGPLSHAAEERAAAVELNDDATSDAERLVLALTAREVQERERCQLLTGRADTAEKRERSVDQEARRLNAIVLELNRLVAEMRLAEAVLERQRLERERDDTRDLVKAWAATSTLVRYEIVSQAAQQIREIIRREENKAEPVLRARDTAAKRFARGLLATASAADAAAKSADAKAEGFGEEIEQAVEDERTAIRDVELANAQIAQATQNIGAARGAVQEAISAGLLADGDDVATAAEVASETAAQGAAAVTHALTMSDELALAREGANEELQRFRDDRVVKAAAADKLGDQVADAQQIYDGLCDESRLLDLLGSEEIELDNDVPTLLDLLGVAISSAEDEQTRLHIKGTEDARILDALGTGGLLPPSAEVEEALRILADHAITSWSGWHYLARIRADERDRVLACFPHLVDGIVLNSGTDLVRARDELAAAHLLPRSVIAVGTTAAIVAADMVEPTGGEFIVPPNPAMYDEERAEEERQETERRREARSIRLSDIAGTLAADQDLRSRLVAWRRDFPPGRLAKLAAGHREAMAELDAVRDKERGQRDEYQNLVKEERALRQQLPSLRDRAEKAHEIAAMLEALAAQFAKIPGWSEIVRRAKSEVRRSEEEGKRLAAWAEGLRQRKLGAHLEAGEHRRTANTCREDLRNILGGGSADETMPAPEETLEALRAAFRAAETNYQKVAVGADLRGEVDLRDKQLSDARAELERLDQAVRKVADELLHTPDGSDPASRDAALGRAQQLAANLEQRVTSAAGIEGGLRKEFESYQPQERSLEPYGRPRDIPHGKELIATATAEWNRVRTELDEVQTRLLALRVELAATEQTAAEFGAVGESLSALVTPEVETASEPFPDTIDAARTRRDDVRETLVQAQRLLEGATKQVRNAADALAKHAADDRFEKVAAPVRRQIMAVDREQLPDFADEWEAALRPRFRVLSDELAQIERHRAAIITRLQGMVTHALGRLRAAQRASKLPAGLDDWSGLEFLRISFTQPEEAVLKERLGQVLDEATASPGGQTRPPGKRDGLSLILSGVRASLAPKGVRVDMLKPDAVLRDERVRVGEVSDVFSGGQQLTAAIILYCTMAWLRAGERGHAQRPHAGVLFLDNPIGRASAGYLLELQIAVAEKLGVQLMYTTGLFDTNALGVFPLIIRLRNDADLRAGMKYLTVDNHIRRLLPSEAPDGTGVLTASRIFHRPNGHADG